MKEWLRNIPLFRIVTGLFLGFLCLAIFNYVVIKSYSDDITEGSFQVDISGKTRMLSQKILLLINLTERDLPLDNDLRKAVNEHDHILETFRYGGTVQNLWSQNYIEPISGRPKAALDRAILLWDSIQNNINTVLNESRMIDSTVVKSKLINSGDSLGTMIPQSTLEKVEILNPVRERALWFLTQNRERWLEANNLFVAELVRKNQERVDDLHLVLLGFLIFNFICILLVLKIFRDVIFQPLEKLGKVSRRIMSGKLDSRFSYNANNEVGNISGTLNSLASNLESSRDFIKSIAKGDIDKKLEISNDELKNDGIDKALLEMQKQMQRRAEEDRQRKWTNEGLGVFVNILRDNNNLKELCDRLISRLVDYTNSNQAGVYLLDDDESNPRLELISLYAFDTHKFEKQSYRIGEGLVGQTFAEGKTTYLLDMPQDYIKITSGLGETNPSNILLVPLISEDINYGVIEIASFRPYEEYQIQFIEQLTENFASTIAGVKVNQKTKQLLKESQQMTEQMQAQEEEMRQNMEELTATQEEMSRKEAAVNQQMKAIDNVMALAEFASDGTVISANEKYLEFISHDERTIMSKTFGDLHSDPSIFSLLMTGQPWIGESLIMSGANYRLKSAFSPIMDESGQISRVVEVVTQVETITISSENEFEEIEENLKQQLEELEITQEQLDAKLHRATGTLDFLYGNIAFVIVNSDSDIIDMSLRAKEQLGSITSIETDIGNDDEISIKGTNNNSITAQVINPGGDAKKYLLIWS